MANKASLNRGNALAGHAVVSASRCQVGHTRGSRGWIEHKHQAKRVSLLKSVKRLLLAPVPQHLQNTAHTLQAPVSNSKRTKSAPQPITRDIARSSTSGKLRASQSAPYRVLQLDKQQTHLLIRLIDASVEYISAELPDQPSAAQWSMARAAQRLLIELEEQTRLQATD